jgi:FixJ family two-component response regulator
MMSAASPPWDKHGAEGPRQWAERFALAENRLVSIIDDDDSLREALVGLVRSLGHRANSFASAEAFLAAGGQGESDCIVADIHMPGLSGLELTRKLANNGCAAPVILITARGEPGLQERAAESGAHCILLKPFPADALISCLDSALAVSAAPG